MKQITVYIGIIFLITPLSLQAQDDWENDGEIENVEIEIIKDREITLPAANRNFEKIPPVITNDKIENIEYFFNNINFQLPDLNVRMRPLRIKDESLSKLYGNYVKAGFGNYVTPYVEGYFNNKRSKEYSYGAHFNYLNSKKGPIDDDNSGSGKLDMDLFGKYFTSAATFSGEAGFDQRVYHFYGYPENLEVDKDTLKQYFNNYHLRGSIESANKKSPFQFSTGFRVDYLKDNRDASESEGQLNVAGEYELGDNAFIRLNADLAVISREDNLIDKKNRNLFRAKPIVGFEVEGLRLEAGFNVAFENDTLGDGDKLHFYPMAKATYPFTDDIEIYAGVRGDIGKNTLRSLSGENPYLDANIPIFSSNKTFDLYGGINGKLSNKMGFGVGLSIANYKNMYFFVNDTSDQSKFNVIYDPENTAVVNLFAQMSINTAEQFRFTIRGDYWGYGTDGIDEAWHKPNYKVSALATYNLFDKFLFNAEAYTVGGITARGDNGNAVKLATAFDLNFKVDYLISDRVSVFLKFNNIFGKEYELYYHYPSRSLQFMGGLTYNF